MCKFCCRICGEKSGYHVLFQWRVPLAADVKDQKENEGVRYPIEPVICNECGHVQLRETLDVDMYNNYLYTPSFSNEFQEYIAEFVDDMEHLNVGKRAIEIGSSNGYLLKKMQDKGWDVLGFEPSVTLAAEAERYGVATLQMCFGNEDSIQSIKEWGVPNVVIMRHVMEHLDDLNGIIGAISNILSEGILVIEVPWLLRIIREKQFYAFFHEHLSYFSVTAIQRLIKQYGFEIIDIKENDLEGGSIAVYACKGRKPYVHYDKISSYLSLEKEWCSIDRVTNFSNEVKAQIEKIKEMVATEKNQGKRVAVWGAGQRSVTLLNICGWDHTDIDYIIDINKNYWWKYISGGGNIQIVPPTWLEEHYVDSIIIMATGYSNEIIAENNDYLKRGGRFIKMIDNN